MKLIDIIAAVRNEEDSIPVFVETINRLNIPESVSLGIILVEDSSVDGTVEVLRAMAGKYLNVRYYSLRKGFGEGPAVVFGMKQSGADAVITMDVDGGHPLDIIPHMIERFLDGADIVQAVRTTMKNRKPYRNIGTSLFGLFTKIIAGMDFTEQNVYYRLVSREYADTIIQNRKCIHFLRIRFPRNNDRRVEKIYFDAEERKLGKSKYNLIRLTRLSIDGLISVISLPRMVCIEILLVIAGILGILFGHFYISLPPIFIAIFILVRYYQLVYNAILDQMEIKEQSTKS
jgi:glycosyltransferase involved in cell wall biosynthesis